MTALVIGLIISIFLAFGMFSSWKNTQALEVVFPYQIPILQAAFFLLLGLVTLAISMKSVEKINIIDVIKDETV